MTDRMQISAVHQSMQYTKYRIRHVSRVDSSQCSKCTEDECPRFTSADMKDFFEARKGSNILCNYHGIYEYKICKSDLNEVL